MSSPTVSSVASSVVSSAVASVLGGGSVVPALFADGAEGMWYDPSDEETLYTDSKGQTKAGIDDPVAIILDKAHYTGRGAELTTTQDFTTGWSLGPNTTVDAGVATVSPLLSSGQTVVQNAGCQTVKHNLYEISFVVANSAGSVTVYLNNEQHAFSAGDGLKKIWLWQTTSTGSGLLLRAGTSGFSGDVSSPSVKQISGSHAVQTTTANKPILRQDANGNRYLEYDGIDDFSRIPSTLFDETSDAYYCFANKQTALGSNPYVLGTETNDKGFEFLYQSNSGYPRPAAITVNGSAVLSYAVNSLNLNLVHSTEWDRSAGVIRYRQNGSFKATSSPTVTADSDLHTPATSYILGSSGTSGVAQVCANDMYGIVTISRTMLEDEMVAVENEFASMIGVTL